MKYCYPGSTASKEYLNDKTSHICTKTTSLLLYRIFIRLLSVGNKSFEPGNWTTIYINNPWKQSTTK